MSIQYRTPLSKKEITDSPRGLRIDFSRLRSLKLHKNIHHSFLTGSIRPVHLITGNIIASELFQLKVKGVDWRSNDVKDCLIKESAFIDNNLGVTALMNNIVATTLYERCSFYDATFTDTVFENVIFRRCDLRSLVIKRCNFLNCKFDYCRTSNKLIEHCILENTLFTSTDIQLETILENFGVVESHFVDGKIRVGDRKLAKEKGRGAIRKIIKEDESLTTLERFNLSAFVEPELSNAAGALDAALDIKTWLPLCRIPSTFNNLLSGFASLLINHYEAGRLPISPILRLYVITTQFDKVPTPNLHLSQFQANWSSVSSKLLPYFQQHLSLIEEITQERFPRLAFSVEGPIESQYYDDFFAASLNIPAVTIESVIPRNSPADLLLFIKDHAVFAALISIFLSSRFKVEIEDLRNKSLIDQRRPGKTPTPLKPRSKAQESVALPNSMTPGSQVSQLLSFEIGPPNNIPAMYKFHLYALFPERIAIDFQMDMRLGLIYKVRDVLIDLISPRK